MTLTIPLVRETELPALFTSLMQCNLLTVRFASYLAFTLVARSQNEVVGSAADAVALLCSVAVAPLFWPIRVFGAKQES
jgi:hypothetical protein